MKYYEGSAARALWAIWVFLLLAGCGGSGEYYVATPGSDNPAGPQPSAAQLELAHELRSRAVPASIDSFRLTVLDAAGATLPPTPQTVPAQEVVRLELGRDGAFTLRIEYLSSGRVVGLYETPVTLSFDSPTRVVDPAWIDASGLLEAIAITPSPASVALNSTVSLAVSATFSGGGQGDVTPSVRWSSDNPEVATVDSSGLVRGLSPGVTTVQATLFGQTASSTVTVTGPPAPPANPIVSVELSPSHGPLYLGVPLQLTATARRQDGTEITHANTTLTWSSSSSTTATVDAQGLVTGLAPGEVTITATDPSSGISGSALLAVYYFPGPVGPPTPPPRVRLIGSAATSGCNLSSLTVPITVTTQTGSAIHVVVSSSYYYLNNELPVVDDKTNAYQQVGNYNAADSDEGTSTVVNFSSLNTLSLGPTSEFEITVPSPTTAEDDILMASVYEIKQVTSHQQDGIAVVRSSLTLYTYSVTAQTDDVLLAVFQTHNLGGEIPGATFTPDPTSGFTALTPTSFFNDSKGLTQFPVFRVVDADGVYTATGTLGSLAQSMSVISSYR